MERELGDFAADLYDFRRMRLGQDVGEIHDILTLPGKQVFIVPLLDYEYDLALERAEKLIVDDSNSAGLMRRQRAFEREQLVLALRHPKDIHRKAFADSEEMMKVLDMVDINYLYEQFVLMTDKSSPSIDGFTEEQIEILKKGLLRLRWNELVGKQWKLLHAFLSSLTPAQLEDNFSGFSSMSLLTSTRSEKPTATDTQPS